MFAFSDLDVPIVAAPMAGGPSTAALAGAVASAGGLGYLAAGYKTPEALEKQIAEVRAQDVRAFGVNLFVPGPPAKLPYAVAVYRKELRAEADRYDTDLPPTDPEDRDWFEAKLELLLRDPVPTVSFTFGLPSQEAVAQLHDADTSVVATVTTVDEALEAQELGVDALALQGVEAGGHRATHSLDRPDEGLPVLDLLARVRPHTDLSLIAAGGLSTGADIARVLGAGASAAQLGTAFLRSPESGAVQAHKDALADPRFTATTITRAFSGRLARGLRNRFIAEHDATAPAAYPEVNQLTKPLRAAAAQQTDPDGLALWAGTAYRHATTESAVDITRGLWDEAQQHL